MGVMKLCWSCVNDWSVVLGEKIWCVKEKEENLCIRAFYLSFHIKTTITKGLALDFDV